jgi:hypothetical protein
VTAPNATAGIDFALETGGTICGTVTSERPQGPLLGLVLVSFYTSSGAYVGSVETSWNDYRSPGLPSGSYFVQTTTPFGLLDQRYPGVPCPAGRCSPTAGTAVTVTASQARCDIDFSLTPTTPADSAMVPASGPASGGTLITILGSGFTEGSTNVIIGGRPAPSVVVVNRVMLRTVTPSGTPGVVPVTVTTPEGTVTVAPGFTYLPPSPQVSKRR